MNDYIEIRFDIKPCSEMITDILASMLCDIGYESFVPDQLGLTAYIKSELYEHDKVTMVLDMFPIPNIDVKWQDTFIEGQDWNHEWENNYFKPIVIGGNKCVIHSTFHNDIPQCSYDIVIDPKMAFGTGHHATTSLILSHLLELDLSGKSLLDMGTGTGILAILAAMRGASPVTAIEIDPMAHANAVENVISNGHPEINVILGDASNLSSVAKVDILLANINRNIILADIERYKTAIKIGGRLFLSGFYVDDIPVLRSKARLMGFAVVSVSEMNNWCCLELILEDE